MAASVSWFSCIVVVVKVTQSGPALCNPTDYTAHGILQARILEWITFPFSRGSSKPRDWTQVSHFAGGFFTSWAISSVQSQPALCNPMACGTPGFPVHHQLLEFTQSNVHGVSDALQPSHPLSPPSPPAPNLSQHQGFFLVSGLFALGGQSIGALASVLSVNSQRWFLLGLNGLISLLSYVGEI